VVEASVHVKNRLGLHLRAASTLAQAVAKFDASLTLARGKQQVNARSVTSLIMLGAGKGATLKARAEGPDEVAALAAVRQLFEQGFGED
jgi:phosphocarrier protein HPr